MASARTMKDLVDELQTEIDGYVDDYENLLTDFNKVMDENDRLKDIIAELKRTPKLND